VRTIAAHHITDTGQWRLTVDISEEAMGAWLRRNDIADDPMYTLASARLEGDDSLHAIENAVYDHPAVLDDFEADIVVTTARYMFVPAELADDADLCVMAFSTVFGDTSAEDVMTDTVGEYAVLYMAVPGLRQFLARTFAGSRVACHATTLLSHWQRVAKAGLCLFADIRGGYADMALFRDGHLIASSRRRCQDTADAAYYMLNTSRAASEDITPQQVAVYVTGAAEAVEAVRGMIGEYVGEMAAVPMPAEEDAPPADVICSYRNNRQP